MAENLGTTNPGTSRTQNYTPREKHLLISLVKRHKEIIESKQSSGPFIRKKAETWARIAQEFNAGTREAPRSAKQLKNLYFNIKRRVRKNATDQYRSRYVEYKNIKNELNRTGEEKFVPHFDEAKDGMEPYYPVPYMQQMNERSNSLGLDPEPSSSSGLLYQGPLKEESTDTYGVEENYMDDLEPTGESVDQPMAAPEPIMMEPNRANENYTHNLLHEACSTFAKAQAVTVETAQKNEVALSKVAESLGAIAQAMTEHNTILRQIATTRTLDAEANMIKAKAANQNARTNYLRFLYEFKRKEK